MHIDLQTVSIKPLRHTFDNIARRIGADKPATRYQEGTLDMQQTANFHYRPTWDPDHDIYDASRTVIKMADWYAFKDPRQFYYGAYTMARAKQQDTAEANFDFVESRGLAANLPEEVRDTVLKLLVPQPNLTEGAVAGVPITVQRTGSLTNALTVNIGIDESERFTFPTSITILAGQSARSFTLMATENALLEGTIPAVLTVSSSGFLTATRNLTIIDNESPALSFTGLPATTGEGSTFGEFLEFETLTLCPIDTRCIDRSLLRADEIDWLNAYHATVQERLAPLVAGEALAWLQRRCQPI